MHPTVSPLPTQRTIRPDRRGLAYHEVVADGLIHTAAFLDIAPGEGFVERLLTVAFANGVRLAEKNPVRAAQTARRVRESAESPPEATLRLATDLAPLFDAPDQPLVLRAREYFRRRHCTGDIDDPVSESAYIVRQLMADALLAGLHFRGLAPAAYGNFRAFLGRSLVDQDFLVSRVWTWTLAQGVPRAHPLLELASSFYPDRRIEHDLIVEGMAEALPSAAALPDPLDCAYWLDAGRRRGRTLAQFAPDRLEAAVEEFDDSLVAENARILGRGLELARKDPAGGYAAAYDDYLATDDPLGLAHPGIRAANPLTLAQRAYDFTFWLAAVSHHPDLFRPRTEN